MSNALQIIMAEEGATSSKGGGLYKASNNVRVSFSTEQINTTQKYKYVGSFYAVYTGEIKISCDLKSGTGTTPTGSLIVAMDAGGYSRGGSSTTWGGNQFLATARGYGSTPLLLDSTTVIGTEYNANVLSGGTGIADPAIWYDTATIGSNSTSTYTTDSSILKFTNTGIIHLLLQGSASSGATSLNCGVKNINISYDIVGGI